MSEQFDFNVVANNDASDKIDAIVRSVRSLYPPLNRLKGELKLGGQETLNGLDSVINEFNVLNTFAKEGIQLIGDMVPPLKMVGGITLGMGAAAAGIYRTVTGMREAGKRADELSTSAQNAGLSVEQFTQLSGAMQILGTDAGSARASVEGLYTVFNEALQGRNNQALALMNQLGVRIAKNQDGTADLVATLRDLSKVFPSLSPQNQKKVSDLLGLDAGVLRLLRAGKFDELMQKASQFGLTEPEDLNQQLTGINGAINELSAAWDGLKQKTRGGLYGLLLSDGSVEDGIRGITDLLVHGPDNVALMHTLGVTRGDEPEQLRKGYNDPGFTQTLNVPEHMALHAGVMTPGLRQKFQAYYGPVNAANQLANDLDVALQRSGSAVARSYPGPPKPGINPYARSVRNNNPWNLNYAHQAGAVLEPDPGRNEPRRFAKFETPQAGMVAAERQLMMYYNGESRAARHRPLRTLEEIISVASPREDRNDTSGMITQASKELNVRPDEPLNLTDPAFRARVLAALFNQEGNNPWSAAQVEAVITGTPVTQVRNNTENKTENNTVSSDSSVTHNTSSSSSTVNNSHAENNPVSHTTVNNDNTSGTPAVSNGTDPNYTRGISEAVREGLSSTRLQIEVTMVDPRTHQRTQATGTTGGRIAVSMPFTG